jgi:anti-anti-sigma factor
VYDGQILYASSGASYVIKLVGELRYGVGPALSAFIERMFKAPDLDRVIIDLGETTFLDSTILGLLARLGMRAKQTLGRECIIVSPREDITETLLGMGFEHVCMLLTKGDAGPASFERVPAEQVTRESLAAILLDAHRALVGMNSKNRDQFQDAVTEMERSFRPKEEP